MLKIFKTVRLELDGEDIAALSDVCEQARVYLSGLADSSSSDRTGLTQEQLARVKNFIRDVHVNTR